MPKTRDTVKVSCWVDKTTQQSFRRIYPHYGMLAWLIEAAMRELIAQTEGDPAAQQRVRQAVRETLRKHQYNPNAQVKTA
jgi:hypothetical protein